MEIKSLLSNFKIKQTELTQPQQFRFGVSCPNLAPLKQDTISFKGTESSKNHKKPLKKDDFQGTDYVVIEKYKINPQKLKSKEQLQDIAEYKIREIMLDFDKSKNIETLKQVQSDDLKDFGGRTEEARIQRKAMLKEWFDYVINENDAYSNTQRLIILSAITKNLKPNTDELPEALNKEILAQTLTELEEKLKSNPKENFDFNKMYKTNLRAYYIGDKRTSETITGWVIIPSKKNDHKNFEKNVGKLQTLSHSTWCTKSYNAEPYLSQGDFHVYLENGEPKLGVRFVENKAVEVEGEKHNHKIPLKYLDIFEKHKKEYNIELNKEANNILEEARDEKEQVLKTQAELGVAMKLKTIDDAFRVLKYFSFKVQKTEDGLVLGRYRQLLDDITFEDYGINENKLFKYIKKIEGDAYFDSTNVTDLGSLESIGRIASFENSKVLNLGKLKSIGESAYFSDSYITNLGELENIDGDAIFLDSKITDLGNLATIGGDANFRSSMIKSLKNLEIIKGNAYFNNSQITDLGKLHTIGKLAYYDEKHSNLTKKDFKNIKILGND